MNEPRVFLLTRSGFAGEQRFSTATWSGDIGTRWEDMRAQMTAGLNYSISGLPCCKRFGTKLYFSDRDIIILTIICVSAECFNLAYYLFGFGNDLIKP